MVYSSWTMQPNILMRLSSVPHECWSWIGIFWVPTYFQREVMSMEGHGTSWWEPIFKGICYMDIYMGMCYMHGMCFAILTPMLHISVCRIICGVIRGKGSPHVIMVSSIALD